MNEQVFLSVIIPGRNQAEELKKTLTDVWEFSKKKAWTIEVVYIDGNSTDHTEEVVANFKSKFTHFKSMKETQKGYERGKGSAVKLGMEETTGRYKMFMDADSSTPFSEIEKFFPYFDEGYQVVMGSRYTAAPLPASNKTLTAFWQALKQVLELVFTGKTSANMTKKKQSWFRQFMSRGGNLAFVTLLGQAFADTRCGFKAYTKEAADILFGLQSLPGFGFDTEILVIAKKYDLKIIEVPVDWYDVEQETNISPLRDSINSFAEIFKIKGYLWSGKYDKKKQN